MLLQIYVNNNQIVSRLGRRLWVCGHVTKGPFKCYVMPWGVGVVSFPGKKRYKCVRFNVISITRGWVGGVKFPEKKALRNTWMAPTCKTKDWVCIFMWPTCSCDAGTISFTCRRASITSAPSSGLSSCVSGCRGSRASCVYTRVSSPWARYVSHNAEAMHHG